jgi:hypothetical protein
MVEIKSCLKDIIDHLKGMRDIAEMKQMIISHLKQCDIDEKHKLSMIEIIQKSTRYQDVLKKVYNFLLKYEGYGVISIAKRR